MRKYIVLGIGIFLIAMNVRSAEAVLLSVNDTVFGVDSITRDTDTGLEWLDIRFSDFRSYEDLVGLDGTNEFNMNGNFIGFRHASAVEVEEFWRNAGIVSFNRAGGATPGNSIDYQVSNAVGTRNLLSFIADTSDNVGFVGFMSDLNPDLSSPMQQRIAFVQSNVDLSLNADVGLAVIDGLYTDANNSGVGNWLVRNTAAVPEPATMILFGTGMIGAAFRRRR